MAHIDDFLREIEQKIQNKEKINARYIHIFANLYAHNCITDAIVIAKLNLFIIDNKIKLNTERFRESFWRCLYYAHLADRRRGNCFYQESPPNEEDIYQLKLKYPGIFEFVPFEQC